MSSNPDPAKTDYTKLKSQRITFFRKSTHLSKLPFWKRYPRATVFGGAFLSFCFVYSAPIYYFFRAPPENPPHPHDHLWPGEIAKGKTYLEQFRERQARIQKEEEKMRAKMKAIAEEKEKKNSNKA